MVKDILPLERLLIYNRLCKLADAILINSGVRKACIKCSTVAPIDKHKTELGCCGGCRYLGKSGCTIDSLACRLWLCHTVGEKLGIRESGALRRMLRLAHKYDLYVVRDTPFGD